MTCLEHLVENTLVRIKKGEEYKNILEQIKNDCNLEYAGITPEQCWEICQYVYYDFMPCEKIRHEEDLIKQLEKEINWYKKENIEDPSDFLAGMIYALKKALLIVKNVSKGE